MTDRPLYRYEARLVRVIDGDTVVLEIDQGFKTFRHDQSVRLLGINTPELHGHEALKAVESQEFTRAWFRVSPSVYIESYRDEEVDHFGRILAVIFRDGDPISLNDALVAAGKAARL